MVRVAAAICLTALLTAFTPVEAGHELPYYPSYYPQEIRIETVDPGSAASLLQNATLHAYIGADPFVGGKITANVSYAESLGAYLVVTFNPTSELLRDRERRCAMARKMRTTLGRAKETYIFHPYPVTPYHMDFLQHYDAAESLKQEYRHRAASADDPVSPMLKVKATGQVAEKLVHSNWQPAHDEWDATLEEIDVGDLIGAATSRMNGWLGPPWVKEGWFHAYRLLADSITDKVAKQTVDSIYRRLVSGDYDGLKERLNLERQFVSLLTRGCERVVVGYTVKREYFNSEFSAGVENIAQDSHTGFNSAIFIRTVKLKDFPWNGWLRLGMNAKPSAAWNPIGGFTDAAGRLIWFAVGDTAFLPAPHSSSWIANRFSPEISVEGSPSEGVGMPREALIPEPGTGILREAGAGKTAKAKITYRVLTSVFQDGTQMAVADLFYAYVFTFRWGVRKTPHDPEYDPHIETSTAPIRERLVGLKIVTVEQEVRALGELQLTRDVPIIEVYVNASSLDPLQVAATAPPWSSLPWHLLVLMEEAVKRGFVAFSQEEARRRSVPWLDLARDQRVKDRLVSLIEGFKVQGYRPHNLERFVTEAEARQRWAALKTFYLAHGHFLVTNGPYRLEKWSENAITLQVFRDLSYPLGVGSYDKYAFPPKAYISKVELRRDRLEISAEVEKVEKFQRTYEIVREPLTDRSMVGVYRIKPVARYIVLGPDSDVLQVGSAHDVGDGMFTVELGRKLRPGRYTILTTIYLNDNYVNPDVKVVLYKAE